MLEIFSFITFTFFLLYFINSKRNVYKLNNINYKKIQDENEKLKIKVKGLTEELEELGEDNERLFKINKQYKQRDIPIMNNKYCKEDIFKVFDILYGDKMSKKTNSKIATRLMNKRKDICDYIINGKEMKDDKVDYSVDFIKLILDLIYENNNKQLKINELINK